MLSKAEYEESGLRNATSRNAIASHDRVQKSNFECICVA